MIMFEYHINFSSYKLRDYEKLLAIREFENQFPAVKEKVINENGISLITGKLLDEQKLRKLAFYSGFRYQNGESKIKNILTDQALVENYHRCQQNLFSGIRPSSTREVRYLTHSIHEYKGRFPPQLAKSLINHAGIKSGDMVLDPFCGCGTTLVESFLFGANAVGVDINPIAVLLAKAKVESILLKQQDLGNMRKSFDGINKNHAWKKVEFSNYHNVIDIVYLQNWFPQDNLKKILLIKDTIRTLPTEKSKLFASVVLSNTLKKFSFQEPSQLRVRRRTDVPPTNFIETFKEKLNEQINRIEKFQSLSHFKLNSNVRSQLGDVRNLMRTTNLKEKSIDVVVTSPPYATALPYVDTDRLSLFVFGYADRRNFRGLERSLIGNREITKIDRMFLDKELEHDSICSVLPKDIVSLLRKIYFLNRDSNVGFRRKNTAALLYKYFLDMNLGISEISRVLKKGKLAFFVVGNNRTKAGGENINIPTSHFISLIAEKNNFDLIDSIPMIVQHGYMIHSKNSINSESILILRRK